MKVTSKAKAHVRYKDSAGNIVPGVTTVTNLLAKPQLIAWANRLGLQGIDSTKYADALADIGTLAHYLIMCHLKRKEPDTSDYSPNEVKVASNCVASYLAWEKNHILDAQIVEEQLVSDELKVGGTPDLYCVLDGVQTLIDFKTGKALYPEYSYQVAGYKSILEGKGYPVEQCRILRIGRDDDEGFEEKIIKDTSTDSAIFLSCLGIYYLQKQKREEEKMMKKQGGGKPTGRLSELLKGGAL